MAIELTLEQRIARLEAVNEIQNLMSRCEYYHSAYQNQLIPPLFADRDDVSIKMPFGVWVGRDAANRCFNGALTDGIPPRDLRGEMVEHTLTTPVIEVARDGQTAKGVWNSPGQEAHRFYWLEDKPLKAFWYWCKYGADFICVDGVWKIWHLHVQETFVSDFYKSWVDGEPTPPPLPPSDRAPDQHGKYDANTAPVLSPLPPVPYDTFDPKTAY